MRRDPPAAPRPSARVPPASPRCRRRKARRSVRIGPPPGPHRAVPGWSGSSTPAAQRWRRAARSGGVTAEGQRSPNHPTRASTTDAPNAPLAPRGTRCGPRRDAIRFEPVRPGDRRSRPPAGRAVRRGRLFVARTWQSPGWGRAFQRRPCERRPTGPPAG